MNSLPTLGQLIGSILNPVTLIFLVVLAFTFYKSITAQRSQRTEVEVSLSRSAPAILTTIGVLGTFVGIYVGLIKFDVAKINTSVPNLLEGMKIAFVTSIVGMLLSVVYKGYQIMRPVAGRTSGTSADDIFLVLSEIRDIARADGPKTEVLLQNLHQAISGDSDSSLSTQLIKMRTELGDKISELSKDFQTFAESMAESNSKSLITALEEVMRDFNAKINEQFGDNFKQLNEAVGQLLVWQENYKDQMDKMLEQLNLSLAATQAAESALGQISNHAKTIPETMSSIEKIIEALNSRLQANSDAMESFRDLGKQAGDAFPIIESNLKNLTESMGSSVSNCVSTIEQTITDMTSSFQNSVKNSQEALGAQIQTLDEQMQTEVKRVVEVMGSHLASLSRKFVDDYTPLTAQLQKLVELGRVK